MNGSESMNPLSAGESYYGIADGTAMLMRIANFPDDVLALLQLEALVAFHAVHRYSCDAIVELGCYDGRSIEMSRSLNLHYVGVDIDAQAIDCLRDRIVAEGLQQRASAVLANALEVDQWSGHVRARRSLIHLPFNFLGSFREPFVLLERLCRMPDALLLISVFNASDYATHVRQRYYSACGVQSLTVQSARDRATFTGDRHFYSRAFSSDALDRMIDDCGADTLLRESNRLGSCVVIKARDTSEVRL